MSNAARQVLREHRAPVGPVAAQVVPAPVAPAHPLLALQQNAGNQAVARLVQRRIAVGAASDRTEREADRLADLILAGGGAALERGSCTDCSATAKCAKCQARDSVSRAAGPAGGMNSALSLPETWMQGLGPGRPLDPGLHDLFGSRLGVELGTVRVHEGAAADRAARAINATAFTAGTDIVFAAGRYNPESEAGRRLIGHELVHVAQQGAGAARMPAPIRRDGFDDPTGAPDLTNRELIDQALKSKDAADVKLISNVSEASVDERIQLIQILLNQFWVGPMDEYKLEDIWRSFGNSLLEIGAKNVALWNQSVDRGAELTALPQVAAFIADFQEMALRTTWAVLDQSAKDINAERIRYGLPSVEDQDEAEIEGDGYGAPPPTMAKGPAGAGLAAAAQILLNKRREISGLSARQEVLVRRNFNKQEGEEYETITDKAAYDQLGQQLEKSRQEYDVLRATMEGRFPILAAYADASDSALEALASGPDDKAAQALMDTIREKLHNITEVQEKLTADNAKVWKLAPIVSATKQDMSIAEDSLRAGFVHSQIDKVETDEALVNLALGALAIGFGLLAALPTGGSSLVAAGAAVGALGTVAVSGYTAFTHLQQYRFEEAAHGTAFDKARAVSSEDPSLFWLAVDIIAAGIDLGAAVKVFQALTPAARAAAAARRAAATTAEEAARAEKLVGELREAAEKQGQHGAELADKVVASARKLQGAETVEEALGAASQAGKSVDRAMAEAEKVIEEEGVLGRSAVEGTGHEVKVTKSGGLVRCTECAYVREVCARQLAENPQWEKRLSDLERRAQEAADIKDADAARKVAQEVTALYAEMQHSEIIAEIFDLLRKGPTVLPPSAEAVEGARAALKAGNASIEDLKVLVSRAVEDWRAYKRPDVPYGELNHEVLKGACGHGRDVSAASLGTLLMDSGQGATIYRYHTFGAFEGAAGAERVSHAFAVVRFPGEPPQLFLVDPTFGQFMRPNLAVAAGSAPSTSGQVLLRDPVGSLMARDLLRDGFVPLTKDNARLYAWGLGITEEEAAAASERLLKGENAARAEEVGGASRLAPPARAPATGASDPLYIDELHKDILNRIRESEADGDPQNLLPQLRDLLARLDEVLRREPPAP